MSCGKDFLHQLIQCAVIRNKAELFGDRIDGEDGQGARCMVIESAAAAASRTSGKIKHGLQVDLCGQQLVVKPESVGDAAGRIRVLNNIMAEAEKYGIAEDRIFIDPLVEMLCAAEDGIEVVIEVEKYIKEHYPDLHIICAVSNISYNLPYRKIVNQAFAAVAMWFGMDAAVMDPLNRDLRGTIYATEALMGEDFFCVEYIDAYREDIFGPVKKD